MTLVYVSRPIIPHTNTVWYAVVAILPFDGKQIALLIAHLPFLNRFELRRVHFYIENPEEEKSTHGKRHIIQLYVNKLNQSWRLTVNSNTSRGQMKEKIVCVLCRWEKPNENSVGVWTEKKMSQIVEWSWRDNENKCKWTAAAKSRPFHVLGCILGEWGESKMFRFLIESRPVVWHGSLD